MNKLLKIFAVTLFLSSCFEESPNMTFKTVDGDINYNLEVAIKDEDQARGLMGRESLKENGGMLFPIAPVQPITMWMKDTKISLDLIFIGMDNRVVKIIEKAEPMSVQFLSSEYPVKAVVEINAGDVAKHKIKVGQYIKSSALEEFEADYKAKRKAVEEQPKAGTEVESKVETEDKAETKVEPQPQTEAPVETENEAPVEAEDKADTNSDKK